MCVTMPGSAHLYHLEEAKEDRKSGKAKALGGGGGCAGGGAGGGQTLDEKDFASHLKEVILSSKARESKRVLGM